MVLTSYRVINLVQIPQKINNIVEIFSLWMWIVDAKRPGGGGRLNADSCGQGGGGSKIGKILRTSFMYDPQEK